MEAQWASRAQSREARRSRQHTASRAAHRRAANRDAEWNRTDERTADCTTCGAHDEVASMYSTGDGLACAACFSQGEGELTAPPDPSIWTQLVLPAAYLPLLFPWAVWVEIGMVPLYPTYAMQPAAWIDFGLWIWGVLQLTSVIYAPFLLTHLAQRVRDLRRDPDRDPDLRFQQIAGHIWHGTAFLGVQALVVLVLYLL